MFFVVEPTHQAYELEKNTVHSPMFVSAFTLHDYPITDADILVRGPEAWNVALNTINVCKYNLGWASIGICTHAFHEAIDHAGHRQLYGGLVTDFSHVRQLFVDAYARLTAMKLFAMRANDYMRSASDDDRRYLLYNPLVKMKVTTEGEHVINALWDVIAAKGFEADTYFQMAARHIRALPKLEGTVHVNIALIVKFMANYFFAPQEYPPVPGASGRRPRRVLVRAGADPWPGQDPVPRLGRNLRPIPFPERGDLPGPGRVVSFACSRPRRPTGRRPMTSTSCSPSGSCSRSSSTAS